MICLVVSQSRFCIATIVFYTCIWIPLVQLKNALLGLLSNIIFFTCQQPLIESSDSVNVNAQPWLPVSRFVDLKQSQSSTSSSSRRCRSRNDVVCGQQEVDHEETCSICLVEFEMEDVVSQLSKCGHVFHVKCIESWLDSNHFTCPLCRSSFLHNPNPNSHAKPAVSDTIDPYTPSYLGYSWH
ncbi:43kDa postsynaptic protein [Trema orientale]|uniref:43kDa postsynaptic protein n=1 Tax=Trema orientale TaxID=63057 RepID=A0A2P5AZ96_TREOI|nr:43kDa postsynaptic protein [Trema orientale]